MAEVEVKLAVLCDDVRHEVEGKVSLMGLFDRFGISNFTQPLPPFRVFVKLAFQKEGQHTLALNIRSTEGDFSVGMQAGVLAQTLDMISGRYIAVLNFGFNQLQVPREGIYRIELVCDGKDVHSIPFQVATVRPPTVQ